MPANAPSRGRTAVVRLLAVAAVLFVLWSSWRAWSARSIAARKDEARGLIGAGDSDAAVAVLKQVVAAIPDDAEAWMLLGAGLTRGGEFDAAAEAYGRAARSTELRPEAAYRRALALVNDGRFEDGETEFLAELQVAPKSEAIVIELHWLYFNQLRERDLELVLESALESDPGRFRILYHLLYASQKRPVAREAVGNLERVNARHPGQATVELALGYCYWHLGDADRARRFIQQARQRRPAHLPADLVWAEFLLEQGDIDAAEAVLTRSGHGAPTAETRRADDRWWWLRSQSALRQRRHGPALEFADKAVELRPGESKYWQTKGLILQALGRNDQAKEALQHASRLAAAQQALFILVSSGAVEDPTAATCRDIAAHLKVLGKDLQAQGWKAVADRLER